MKSKRLLRLIIILCSFTSCNFVEEPPEENCPLQPQVSALKQKNEIFANGQCIIADLNGTLIGLPGKAVSTTFDKSSLSTPHQLAFK